MVVSSSLIVSIWTTLYEAQQAIRYPELLQIDPTGGTNNLSVPVLLLCGADGNNHTFLWGTVFLAEGELKVGFAWVLRAVTRMYGVDVTRRIRLTISDGDDKICESIENAISAGEWGGRRGRCFWHLFYQEYTKYALVGADEAEKANLHEPI